MNDCKSSEDERVEIYCVSFKRKNDPRKVRIAMIERARRFSSQWWIDPSFCAIKD